MLYTDTMTVDGLATDGSYEHSDKMQAYLAYLPTQIEHILTRVTPLVEQRLIHVVLVLHWRDMSYHPPIVYNGMQHRSVLLVPEKVAIWIVLLTSYDKLGIHMVIQLQPCKTLGNVY